MIYWIIIWELCAIMDAPAWCYALLVLKAILGLIGFGVKLGE